MEPVEEVPLIVRPTVNTHAAIRCAREAFGLEVENHSTAKELDSYIDRNFFLTGRIEHWPNSRYDKNGKDGTIGVDVQEGNLRDSEEASSSNKGRGGMSFVLKVMNSKFNYSADFLDASISTMSHVGEKLGDTDFEFPVNIPNKDGDYKVFTEFDVSLEYLASQNKELVDRLSRKEIKGNGKWRISVRGNGDLKVVVKHYARLLSYIEGRPLKYAKLSDELFYEAGVLAGSVSKALQEFCHPSFVAKQCLWDLKNLFWLRSPKYLDPVKDKNRRCMLEVSFELFEKNFMPFLGELPKQTIHADISESNIITRKINTKDKVTGLVDFGEVTYSFRLFEIAISMAYLSLLRPNECIKTAGIVLSGYLSRVSLTELELRLLYYCVIGRFVQSLAIGNYSYVVLDPNNEYLLTTSKQGWKVLETFLEYKDKVKEIQKMWSNQDYKLA